MITIKLFELLSLTYLKFVKNYFYVNPYSLYIKHNIILQIILVKDNPNRFTLKIFNYVNVIRKDKTKRLIRLTTGNYT